MAISITRRGLTLSAVAGTALAGAAGLASRAAATGEGGFGIDLAAMDRSVVPGDDFYRRPARSPPTDRAWPSSGGWMN
jgi:hypothetical protein